LTPAAPIGVNLDPVAASGNVSWLLEVLEHVPGVALARRVLGAVERELLSALKERLDQTGNGVAPASGAAPAALLSDLLARAADQTQEESQRRYFVRLLEQIVPDEARILAALSDGSMYPLVDVGYRPRFGRPTQHVLENASSVGKAAGVTWPDAVPRYLAHLRELGLVESGREDPELALKYEIVETETAVRDAIRRVRAVKRSPRMVRRTLRISDLGRALWGACQPHGPGKT